MAGILAPMIYTAVALYWGPRPALASLGAIAAAGLGLLVVVDFDVGREVALSEDIADGPPPTAKAATPRAVAD